MHVAAIVDERLASLLPDSDKPPAELHAAMRYSCLAPGKRLRPALCLAAGDAVGAAAPVLDAACAIEMVHAFSLIHDDLPSIDNDDLRRGLPTCHVKFGEAIAILAGDALFALAYETLSKVSGEPDRVLKTLQILSRAAGSDGLVGGEVADVQSEGKLVSNEMLKFIHTRKTGALMAASCEIGALLGGGNDAQVARLADYGWKVGLAFQIADDLLNEGSSAEVLGKAVGSDRLRQKATYPALYGSEKSREVAVETTARSCSLAEDFANSDSLVALARHAIDRLS